jgi:hypothetical protein
MGELPLAAVASPRGLLRVFVQSHELAIFACRGLSPSDFASARDGGALCFARMQVKKVTPSRFSRTNALARATYLYSFAKIV